MRWFLLNLIGVRVILRKRILFIRFRERDLAELDVLAKRVGMPSRSRLINIALQTFLDSYAEHLPILGEKRPVKILLDLSVKERLDEAARCLRAPKSDLVRIALKEFEQSGITSA
jgi:metal-responsive CopG/Arc/MetJ family transcriptional regulator